MTDAAVEESTVPALGATIINDRPSRPGGGRMTQGHESRTKEETEIQGIAGDRGQTLARGQGVPGLLGGDMPEALHRPHRAADPERLSAQQMQCHRPALLQTC